MSEVLESIEGTGRRRIPDDRPTTNEKDPTLGFDPFRLSPSQTERRIDIDTLTNDHYVCLSR